ncbi:MAG: hypothetical protein ACYC1D_18690 [Acidimicrobiales bacterium]
MAAYQLSYLAEGDLVERDAYYVKARLWRDGVTLGTVLGLVDGPSLLRSTPTGDTGTDAAFFNGLIRTFVATTIQTVQASRVRTGWALQAIELYLDARNAISIAQQTPSQQLPSPGEVLVSFEGP